MAAQQRGTKQPRVNTANHDLATRRIAGVDLGHRLQFAGALCNDPNQTPGGDYKPTATRNERGSPRRRTNTETATQTQKCVQWLALAATIRPKYIVAVSA
eukprot:756681-Lingulodinium_polyedra.AAC.1